MRLLFSLTLLTFCCLQCFAGTITLDAPTNVRYQVKGVLELKTELPAQASISIPTKYQVVYLDSRQADGSLVRTSTGYVTPVQILSAPNVSQSKIDELNATAGGLFVMASIVGDMQGIEGDFAPLVPGQPGGGFLANYEASGKPTFSYSKSIRKRFGTDVNKAVDSNTQSPAVRKKWQAIYLELQRAANRQMPTAKSLLMIDPKLAVQESIDFEKSGHIPLNGAWTIAVHGTAARHGFPNVPCAEFVSEQIREAYKRAGYNVNDDFNGDNQLFWTNTASVAGLSAVLHKVGWIPWDSTAYIPPLGALLMNGSGDSPGHAYVSAGDNGRFIIDNGAPQGRDLRTTKQSIISMMYQTGVFFLPPGVNPEKWP